MDRDRLYQRIAERKRDDRHALPYNGGNGRIDRFLDLVRVGALPRGGRVLDVGGSHGDLVELGVREGLFDDGCVVDISTESVFTAKRRGLWAEDIDVDRDGLHAFDDHSFDCVAALDFIEHIVDPGAFATECHRVLRPGGYVFINTPNISYWRHLEELVVRGRFPHTSGDMEVYHGGHLGFYNENDLVDIFAWAGFHADDTQVHREGVGDPAPPIWHRLFSESDLPKKDRMLSQPNLLFSARKR